MKKLMLCLLLGCYQPPERARPQREATLEVANEGISSLIIRFGGYRLGLVQPGSARCFMLPHVSGAIQLSVREIGGFREAYSPSFIPSHSSGWSWKLGNSVPFQVFSLQPS